MNSPADFEDPEYSPKDPAEDSGWGSDYLNSDDYMENDLYGGIGGEYEGEYEGYVEDYSEEEYILEADYSPNAWDDGVAWDDGAQLSVFEGDLIGEESGETSLWSEEASNLYDSPYDSSLGFGLDMEEPEFDPLFQHSPPTRGDQSPFGAPEFPSTPGKPPTASTSSRGGFGEDYFSKGGSKRNSARGNKKPKKNVSNVWVLGVTLLATVFAVIAITISYSRDESTTIVQNEFTSQEASTANVSTLEGGDATDTTQRRIQIVETELTAVEYAASIILDSSVKIETTNSAGSGFFYDESGLIITAAHVVTDSDGSVHESVTVGITQGDRISYRVRGEVLGTDQRKDIAVIKVDTDINFQVAQLALEDSVKIGQNVVAVGAPFGLENTVTAGIVSAVERTVTSGGGEVLGFNLIQTDAPINTGNSGGALANLNGDIIGVNILIQTGSTGTSGNVGVGFAVPIAQAKEVADGILNGENSDALGYLGIQGRSSTLGQSGALVVDVVVGEPAHMAGIRQGDLIVKADGKDINSFTDLLTIVQLHQPNDQIELLIYRAELDSETGEPSEGGEYVTIVLTLGSATT